MAATRRTPSLAVAAVLACLLAGALAGCGSDGSGAKAGGSGGSGDSKSSTTVAGGSATDDGPVSIEHRFGTTAVRERPQRIVSLDAQWTDVLLALDAPPVGYLLDPNVKGGSFSWRKGKLDGATGIKAVDSLPFEQIAALKPDLIVVSYFARDEGDYQRLAGIAPTITTLTDNEVDSWQDIAEVAGKVLREPEAATALVDDVDGQVAKVAADLPELKGKTYALVNYVPGDKFYIVADPDDGAAKVFEQLGMAISPKILDIADDVTGRAEVSLEQSSLLDADVLILLTNGGDPEDIVGYDSLPAVRSGAVAILDYEQVTGLNTPSPLSLPVALEAIRPALEKAAA